MVATASILEHNWGNAPSQTDEDFDKIDALGVNILAGTEARDRAARFADWLAKHPLWAEVPFKGAGAGDTPIHYRRDLVDLLDAWDVEVTAPRHVRDRVAHAGAGPATVNPKLVCVGVFGHKASGRQITVINAHLIPSWTRSKKYLGVDEWRARREYGQQQVALILNEIHKAKKGLVVVTGDFNASTRFPLMKPLVDVVDFGRTGPTLGHSAVDLVGVLPMAPGVLVSVSRKIITDLSSDHDSVLAELTLSEKHVHPVTPEATVTFFDNGLAPLGTTTVRPRPHAWAVPFSVIPEGTTTVEVDLPVS